MHWWGIGSQSIIVCGEEEERGGLMEGMIRNFGRHGGKGAWGHRRDGDGDGGGGVSRDDVGMMR